jgi:hypothetical protein
MPRRLSSFAHRPLIADAASAPRPRDCSKWAGWPGVRLLLPHRPPARRLRRETPTPARFVRFRTNLAANWTPQPARPNHHGRPFVAAGTSGGDFISHPWRQSECLGPPSNANRAEWNLPGIEPLAR